MSTSSYYGLSTAPYPGLRPFRSGEIDIFFGRQEHIDQLLEKLGDTHFLAVTGPCGCGKSSLVHAGLIPALESGLLPSAGAQWRIAEMRPGNHPIQGLVTNLLAASALGPERDCTLFRGLPEAMNASEFLTPQLTREQRQEAIVEPAKLFGDTVAPALVNRLLNDMGSTLDQLPLMQYALMRMWTNARADGQTLTAGTSAAGVTLTVVDYDNIGGFDEALSRHAEAAFALLNAPQQRTAEVLFRYLSERSPDRGETHHRQAPLETVAPLVPRSGSWARLTASVIATRGRGVYC